MAITLITQENSSVFLSFVPDSIISKCDVFFGAFDEDLDTACGVVAAEALEDKTLIIRFIYVAKEFRNRGYGKGMIEALIDFGRECKLTSIICSHRIFPDEDPDSLSMFFEHCDFNKLDYTKNYTRALPIQDFNMKKLKPIGKVISLSELPPKYWDSYKSKIDKMAEDDEKGEIVPLGNLDDYDHTHSLFCLNDKNKIVGAILFSKEEDGLYLNELRTFGSNTETIVYSLIKMSMIQAKEDFPENSYMYVNSDSRDFCSMIEQATGTKSKDAWYNIIHLYFLKNTTY